MGNKSSSLHEGELAKNALNQARDDWRTWMDYFNEATDHTDNAKIALRLALNRFDSTTGVNEAGLVNKIKHWLDKLKQKLFGSHEIVKLDAIKNSIRNDAEVLIKILEKAAEANDEQLKEIKSLIEHFKDQLDPKRKPVDAATSP